MRPRRALTMKRVPPRSMTCLPACRSITCIHAAPPPVFLPMESTWANYTNITRAEAQAAQDAALRVREGDMGCPI